MNETHRRNEILRRHPEVENKIQVWNIDDPICLPSGFDEKVFAEIKEKVAKLAVSI